MTSSDVGVTHSPPTDGTGGRRGSWRRLRDLGAEHWPLWLLLAVGLILIFAMSDDFGAQWDDPANARIGAAALRVYMGDPAYFELPAQADHGPFFFMLTAAAGQVLGRLLPGWRALDLRHVMNALSLLAGLCAVYAISLRFMRRPAAAVTTWFFAAQPLIFGHGFVNQKDIPFMSFFAASMALGMYAADGWSGARRRPGEGREAAPRPADAGALAAAWGGTLLAGMLVVDAWGTGAMERAAHSLLAGLYSGEVGGWARRLFLLVATDSYKTPLDLYQDKLTTLLFWMRLILTPLLLVLVVAVWCKVSARVRSSVRSFLAGPYPLLILAGVVLGCAVSIRQYALLAGGLVGLLILLRAGRKSALPIGLYALTTCLTAVATWPYLWANPVIRFLQSLGQAGAYGETTVLFRGHVYVAGTLPWSYVPTLMGVELTEPAVLLIVAGCAVLAGRLWRREGRALELLTLVTWWILPIVAIFAVHATIYDNLRHVLFVLPPAFVIAGLAIDEGFCRLRRRWLRTAAAILILLPGLAAIVRLHPYESSYFNALAGGLPGASANYYLDPMCITYREAAAIINDILEPNAVVSAEGPYNNVISFARKDLMIVSSYNRPEASYLLVCKRMLFTDFSQEGFVPRAEITREGAVLARLLERREAK